MDLPFGPDIHDPNTVPRPCSKNGGGEEEADEEEKTTTSRSGLLPNRSTEYRFPDSNSVDRVGADIKKERRFHCAAETAMTFTPLRFEQSPHTEEIFRYTSSDA